MMDNGTELNLDVSDGDLNRLFEAAATPFDPISNDFFIDHLDELLHKHGHDQMNGEIHPQEQLPQHLNYQNSCEPPNGATLETPEITQDGLSPADQLNDQTHCVGPEAGQKLNDLINRCVFGPELTPSYPYGDGLDLNFSPEANLNDDDTDDDDFLQPPLTQLFAPQTIAGGSDQHSQAHTPEPIIYFPQDMFKPPFSNEPIVTSDQDPPVELDSVCPKLDKQILHSSPISQSTNQVDFELKETAFAAKLFEKTDEFLPSSSVECTQNTSFIPTSTVSTSVESLTQQTAKPSDLKIVKMKSDNTISAPKPTVTPTPKDCSKLVIGSRNFEKFPIILPTHNLAPNVKLTKPGQKKEKPAQKITGNNFKNDSIRKGSVNILKSPSRKSSADVIKNHKCSGEVVKSQRKEHKKRKISSDIIKNPVHTDQEGLFQNPTLIKSVPKVKTNDFSTKKKFLPPVKLSNSSPKKSSHKENVQNRKKAFDIKNFEKTDKTMSGMFPSISSMKIPKKNKDSKKLNQEIVSSSPLSSNKIRNKDKATIEKGVELKKDSKDFWAEVDSDIESKSDVPPAKKSSKCHMDSEFSEMSPSKSKKNSGEKRKLEEEPSSSEPVEKKKVKCNEGDSVSEDKQTKKKVKSNEGDSIWEDKQTKKKVKSSEGDSVLEDKQTKKKVKSNEGDSVSEDRQTKNKVKSSEGDSVSEDRQTKKKVKSSEGDSMSDDKQAKKKEIVDCNEASLKKEPPKSVLKLKSCLKKPKPVEQTKDDPKKGKELVSILKSSRTQHGKPTSSNASGSKDTNCSSSDKDGKDADRSKDSSLTGNGRDEKQEQSSSKTGENHSRSSDSRSKNQPSSSKNHSTERSNHHNASTSSSTRYDENSKPVESGDASLKRKTESCSSSNQLENDKTTPKTLTITERLQIKIESQEAADSLMNILQVMTEALIQYKKTRWDPDLYEKFCEMIKEKPE